MYIENLTDIYFAEYLCFVYKFLLLHFTYLLFIMIIIKRISF